MKIIVKLFFLLGIILFSKSCYSPQIEYFSTYRKQLHEGFKGLGNQTCILQEASNESFREIYAKLSQAEIDFENVYMEMPLRIIKIRGELKLIKIKMKLVDAGLELYFRKIKEVSDSIQIKELKEVEDSLNQKHKDTLQSIRYSIAEDIQNIETLLNQTEDLRRILVISLMKRKVGKAKEAIEFLWGKYRNEFQKLLINTQKGIFMTSKASINPKDLRIPCIPLNVFQPYFLNTKKARHEKPN